MASTGAWAVGDFYLSGFLGCPPSQYFFIKEMYLFIFFMSMGVLLHVCVLNVCSDLRSQEGVRPPELELPKVVSSHVGARILT